MLISLFVFVFGPQKGWPWLTANAAISMLAVAIPIAIVTKLRFLRTYELDVPGRSHELPRTAVDRTMWLLTSPTVTALTVSLLIVFLWQLRGWKSNEALLYAMVSYFSLSLSIFLAATVQWAFAQNVVGRLALILFGVAFYVAGTLATTP